MQFHSLFFTFIHFGFRACFKNRMAPVFAKKAGWLGATSGASPQRAVTDVATTPDGLFRENSLLATLFCAIHGSFVVVSVTGALIDLKQALRSATNLNSKIG
jgi:hypothetical protein